MFRSIGAVTRSPLSPTPHHFHHIEKTFDRTTLYPRSFFRRVSTPTQRPSPPPPPPPPPPPLSLPRVLLPLPLPLLPLLLLHLYFALPVQFIPTRPLAFDVTQRTRPTRTSPRLLLPQAAVDRFTSISSIAREPAALRWDTPPSRVARPDAPRRSRGGTRTDVRIRSPAARGRQSASDELVAGSSAAPAAARDGARYANAETLSRAEHARHGDSDTDDTTSAGHLSTTLR